MRIEAAGLAAEVDDRIAGQVLPWCDLERFRTSTVPSQLSVACDESLEPARSNMLKPGEPEHGHFCRSGNHITVCFPRESIVGAQQAVKLLFHRAAVLRRGLLLHAAGIIFGDRAIAVTGPSAAGKSTLARLCVESVGAEALSDEMVILCPDGSVHGTPLWSDYGPVGCRRAARLVGIFGLRKGDREVVSIAPPADAVRLLSSQSLRWGRDEPSLCDLLQCAAELVSSPGVRWLTFRKDAAAARFLQEWTYAAGAAHVSGRSAA
jgi:hypothetical protein